MAVTDKNLLELQVKINKEQQDARHQQNNKIQELSFMIDDIKTDNTLLKQTTNIMKEDIKEIKDDIKKLSIDLKETFVTKEAHNETKNKVNSIYNWFYWLTWLVFSILIAALLYKIWVWIK